MVTAGRPQASSRAASGHSVGENTEGTGTRPSPRLSARLLNFLRGLQENPTHQPGHGTETAAGHQPPPGPPGGGPSRAPVLTQSEDVCAGHPSSLTPRVYFQTLAGRMYFEIHTYGY